MGGWARAGGEWGVQTLGAMGFVIWGRDRIVGGGFIGAWDGGVGFCRGNMVDAFRTHIMQTKDLGTCPVRQIGGCSFLYMRISNVYIVTVVSSNANAACAFKFVVEVLALDFLSANPGSPLLRSSSG
jgi:hypothetical protein